MRFFSIGNYVSIEKNPSGRIALRRRGGGIMMRLCELKCKEVINVCDGKRLGFIVDLLIDECNGHIHAIVIPKAGKKCSFFSDGSEYVIPF